MPSGQLWVTDSLGGFMYADKLSRELRMAVQPMVKFRQFCDAKDATKARNPEGNMLGKGDLFHWNVYSDVSDQGGTLVETTTMPETGFTITQGTLTVTEYGNSVLREPQVLLASMVSAMARVAYSDDIRRIEYPCLVILYENDMVDMKNVKFFKNVGFKTTILACIVISLQDRHSESCVCFVTTLASRLSPKEFSESPEIEVCGEPIGVLIGIIIPMFIAQLETHLTHRWMVAFLSSLIPCWFFTGLGTSATWVMPTFVFWDAKTAPLCFRAVNREGFECFVASTLADNDGAASLLFGNVHGSTFLMISMLPDAGKLEKCVNCWDPLRAVRLQRGPQGRARMLENWRIGKSAAKRHRNVAKVQRLGHGVQTGW